MLAIVVRALGVADAHVLRAVRTLPPRQQKDGYRANLERSATLAEPADSCSRDSSSLCSGGTRAPLVTPETVARRLSSRCKSPSR